MGTLVTGVQTCALPIFAAALVHMLGPMPAALRRSITFDNGTEFNRHQRIANQLELDAYFCHPRAPWQKGGGENAIGRLRSEERRVGQDGVGAGSSRWSLFPSKK